jgi:hypothetical protein
VNIIGQAVALAAWLFVSFFFWMYAIWMAALVSEWLLLPALAVWGFLTYGLLWLLGLAKQ